MQITVEQQLKSQVKLTIELSPDEMRPYLEKAAEALSRQLKIEGFRPGKASLGIVTQKVGAQRVWEEAAELAVRKTFVQAIREKNLPTIGQPHVHILKLAPDNPFVYAAESAVLPAITVGDYASFKAKQNPAVVTPAEVDKALEDLREMFQTEVLVDRAAKHGDKAEVDIDLSQDNVAIDGGSTKNHPIVIGSGHFIPGFEDQLVGLKKGATKSFSLPFPKEYHNQQLAGKHGNFTVTVKSVFAVTPPELNDELAKKAGKFENLPQLRRKLEENLRSEADDKEDAVFERAIMDELIARSTFGDLPDLLVNGELDKMLHELQEQVTQRGGKWEDYLTSIKKSADDLKQEFRLPAEKRVKAALLIRQIAKVENIEADPKQVEAEVASTKKMYAGQGDILKRVDSADYRDYLKSLQVNKKVIEFLKSKTGAATP
ncbi:MAG: trigger factor [Patescibacteria group bacterium]